MSQISRQTMVGFSGEHKAKDAKQEVLSLLSRSGFFNTLTEIKSTIELKSDLPKVDISSLITTTLPLPKVPVFAPVDFSATIQKFKLDLNFCVESIEPAMEVLITSSCCPLGTPVSF